MPEQGALHQAMDEGAHTELFCRCLIEDRLDPGAVAETLGGTGGVGQQLAQDVAGELAFIGQQQLFQFADIGELPAVPQFAGVVDGLGEVVDERLAVLAEAGRGFGFVFRIVVDGALTLRDGLEVEVAGPKPAAAPKAGEAKP